MNRDAPIPSDTCAGRYLTVAQRRHKEARTTPSGRRAAAAYQGTGLMPPAQTVKRVTVRMRVPSSTMVTLSEQELTLESSTVLFDGIARSGGHGKRQSGSSRCRLRFPARLSNPKVRSSFSLGPPYLLVRSFSGRGVISRSLCLHPECSHSNQQEAVCAPVSLKL